MRKKFQFAADRIIEEEARFSFSLLMPSVFHLFRFSTGLDRFLISVGAVFSLINGTALPVTTLLFGNIIDAMITFSEVKTPAVTSNLESEVQFTAVALCVIGACTAVVSYIQTCAWMTAGENQV